MNVRKHAKTRYRPVRCGCCGFPCITVQRRRMNTQYVHEESNWMTSCFNCFEDSEDYYYERWCEYYSSQGYSYCSRDKYERKTVSRGPY